MRFGALAIAAVCAGQGGRRDIPLPPESLYLLKTKTLEGKDADLKAYAGKVVLVVNLASQ